MESMVDDTHDSRDGERERREDEEEGETTISRHFLLAPRFKKVACEREEIERESSHHHHHSLPASMPRALNPAAASSG